MILDRPNPNGYYVDGPVIEKEYFGFLGLHPVPVVYGMTIGEYGKMIMNEGWLKTKSNAILRWFHVHSTIIRWRMNRL